MSARKIAKNAPPEHTGKLKDRLLGNYWACYTLAFCVLFFFCFGFWFLLYGKSLFRVSDGLEQHYLIFLYIGKWLRSIAKGLLFEHALSVPLWDMSMGYGSDILPTLGLYLPDPFNWLSVLFPSSWAELGFNLTIVLKFYAVGLAFSFFGFHRGYGERVVLFGSILYTFSAVSYVAFTESPFINPMYIFPLVMIGLDKVWKGEDPLMYVLAMAFSFINYFYFAYMMGLLVAGYCVLYYLTAYAGRRSVANFLRWLLRILGLSVLAVGISAVVLLPILGLLAGQGRLSADYYLPLLYDFSYYKELLLGFVSWHNMLKDAFLGFGVVALPCLWWLFAKCRSHALEKWSFVLLTIVVCVPALGSVMNGFSYYCNRWIWAYALCVADIACMAMPELWRMERAACLRLTLFMLAYFAAAVLLAEEGDAPVVALFAIALAVCLLIGESKALSFRVFQGGMVALAAVCVVASACCRFSEDYGDATSTEVESGTALSSLYSGNGLSALKDVDWGEGYRFDTSGVSLKTNANWIDKASGFDLYISLYNNDIVSYHNSLALACSASPQRYQGLGRRSELEYLSATKYFLVPKDGESLLPVGFDSLDEQASENRQGVLRYEDDDALPVVFGYKSSASLDEYEALSPYQRQQLLMRSVVLDLSDSGTNEGLPDDEVTYEEELGQGISKSGGSTYVVESDGAELTLKFDAVRSSEIYVYLGDVLRVQDAADGTANFSVSLQARCGGVDVSGLSGSFSQATNRTHMYAGKDDWLVCLGCSDDEVDEVVVRFEKAGTYTIGELSAYAKPVEEIKQSRENLLCVTDDVEVGTNTISAHVDASDAEYLYIAVPYSKGWTAYLDGEEVEIEKANVAFMAVRVEDGGEHELRLEFFTPYLREGAAVSVASLIAALLVCCRRRKAS